MTEVLVFGKNGQLATELAKQVLAAEGLKDRWVFVSSQEANFENPDLVLRLLDEQAPKIVINAAAFTAVDLAETETEKAWQINGLTPGVIAGWCSKHGSSLIHFSTDYVYAGGGDQPMKETSDLAPQNKYGESKLEGERQIQKADCHHYIFRTSWIYSAVGNNFVKTMLRLGREREQLKVVSDQIGAPTSARDLASALLRLLRHPQFFNERGVFHLAAQGFVSWCDFAKEIFRESREITKSQGELFKVQEVIPILTKDYPTPAVRPLNSRLNQNKFLDTFGFSLSTWQVGLKSVLAELLL
jgi:dTDP-4-dehydrorhamnose reductase